MLSFFVSVWKITSNRFIYLRSFCELSGDLKVVKDGISDLKSGSRNSTWVNLSLIRLTGSN